MQLSSLMTKEVRTVSPDTLIQKAAEQMAILGIGVLPVAERGRPVGIVTDRDIAIRAVARNYDIAKTKVKDVMTSGVLSVPAAANVQDVARLMKERQIRRVIVVDEAGLIDGIVSLGDLALDKEDQGLSSEVLQGVSSPPSA